MRPSNALVLLATIASPLPWSVATAQSVAPRGGVADRARPAFDAPGIRAGSFLLFPTVTGRAEYDDNVLASAAGKQGDRIFYLEPELRIRSDLGRHAVDGKVYYHRSFHDKLGSEDATEYGATGRGVVDMTRRTRIKLSGGYERNAENRRSLASFSGSRSPVRFDMSSASLGLEQEVSDFTLSGKGDYQRIAYADTTDALGNVIDLKFRNLKVRSATAQIDYRLRSGTTAFVRAIKESRRYDLRPGDPGFDPFTQTDRSADGLRIEGGVGLELTSLIYGNVRIGYLRERYTDPKLRDVDGLSYGADLLWNVTPLTTLRFTATRSVDVTSSQTTAGNLRNEFSAKVDHELLRYVILSAGLRRAHIDPAGPTAKSREFEGDVGVRYLMNRQVELRGGFAYEERSSANAAIRFSGQRIFLGLTFKR